MDLKLKVLQSFLWKKSTEECAKRIGISLEDYLIIKEEVKQEQEKLELQLKEAELEQEILEFIERNGNGVSSFSEDLDKKTAEFKLVTTERPMSSDEIEQLINLDKSKWKISKYSMWNSGRENKWLTSVKVDALNKKDSKTEMFQEFLKNYTPRPELSLIFEPIERESSGCLIINKQDAHLNKFDIHGNNDINLRFSNILKKTSTVLLKSTIQDNLEEIVYILGSDLLDSEWTGTTTKFTPQTSVTPYQESFEAICNHEISMIDMMLSFSDKVYIPFIPGNHDRFAGWHMVNFLKAFYRNESRVNIDTDPSFTKYYKYSNSAFMLNHGDVMRPEKLAQVFPIEFKDKWSECDHFNILSGDKHSELTRDIGNIRFYRVPAWSKVCSVWDSQHGWNVSKGEIQALYVAKNDGITTIYKEVL